MPHLTVGENELFYAVTRSGNLDVVLIHGAGGNHLLWPAALRRLQGATVYALDLPGHGRSRGPGRELIGDYAADVAGFMEAAGIDRAVLMGHSMGGAIAQQVALEIPQRVGGLVLLGTGARLPVAPAILEGIQHDPSRTVEQIMAWAWGPGAKPRKAARPRAQWRPPGLPTPAGPAPTPPMVSTGWN